MYFQNKTKKPQADLSVRSAKNNFIGFVTYLSKLWKTNKN